MASHVLIVDRWTDPESGAPYRKGDTLPSLDEAQVKRLTEARAIVEEGTVLADVAKGKLDPNVVSGTGNMTADGLRRMAETYSRLADEREELEQGLKGQNRTAFVHAKSEPSGSDQGTDASGNRLKAPTFEDSANETISGVEKAEVKNVESTQGEQASGDEVKASDSARKEARDSGVDISEVKGTGRGGSITVEDVKRHAGGQG